MVDADTIAVLVDRNRPDLRGAARALIAAANDSGGEDNITAVLFELTSDGQSAPPPAYVSDDEDTLHPEDGVALPSDAWYPEADTMVVSADDWQRAIAEEEQPLPLARLFASTALIVALIALIAVLSIWGLTR
jgi:hypothetical protein